MPACRWQVCNHHIIKKALPNVQGFLFGYHAAIRSWYPSKFLIMNKSLFISSFIMGLFFSHVFRYFNRRKKSSLSVVRVRFLSMLLHTSIIRWSAFWTITSQYHSLYFFLVSCVIFLKILFMRAYHTKLEFKNKWKDFVYIKIMNWNTFLYLYNVITLLTYQ